MKAATAIPILVLLLTGSQALAWDLVMPDTVRAGNGPVTLADLALAPVPASAATLVVHGGGRPNTTVTLSRQGLLRRLVDADLARDVRMMGSAATCLLFDGRRLDLHDLEEAVRRAVQPAVPGGEDGAPASWIELELPDLDLDVDDGWRVAVEHDLELSPGRNLIPCHLVGGENRDRFTATVNLHVYGEVATSRGALGRNTSLSPTQFEWTWVDLSEVQPGAVIGRKALAGHSLTKAISEEYLLRNSDIAATPVIRSGDVVDLTITRGSLAVTVQGTARQPGCLGQTIPVRNEVSGRLVHARVTGPGLVEWRR
jgi:flagella basal body P-ring formation protein FlgA